MKMRHITSTLSIAPWLILCTLIGTTLGDDDEPCTDKNWQTLETPETSRAECGPAFEGRCHCQMTCYNGRHQYVVNCTDTKFRNTKPLEHLPEKTEVLIFTGNNLETLPWNIFGDINRTKSLRVIDMSRNKIREIKGKSYHRVPNVERLILDFNDLSLDKEADHPRVFSNFVSLLELHLTDAFEDGTRKDFVWATRSTDLAETLHDIFVNR